MKIILCYGKHPSTTGEFIEKSLRKTHTILTVGTVKDGSTQDVIIEDPFTDIAQVINNLDFDVDYVLFLEGGIPFFPKNIEKIDQAGILC